MEPSKRAPAFQLYPQDFISSVDVQMMSAAQVGAYCLLLFNSWTQPRPAYLPNNEKLLQRLSRLDEEEWRAGKKLLLSKFPATPDGKFRRNPRLAAEADKQADFRDKQAANGKRGGRPKKPTDNPGESQNNPGLSSGFFLDNPKKALPSSTSSSSSEVSSLRSETPPTPVVGVFKKKIGVSVSDVEPWADAPSESPPVANVPPLPPPPAWLDEARELAAGMYGFFNLSTEQADAQRRVLDFVKARFALGKGPHLTEQFVAYRAFKTESGQNAHSWQSYLGPEGGDYTSGGWNAAHWPNKLTAYRNTHVHAAANPAPLGRPATGQKPDASATVLAGALASRRFSQRNGDAGHPGPAAGPDAGPGAAESAGLRVVA